MLRKIGSVRFVEGHLSHVLRGCIRGRVERSPSVHEGERAPPRGSRDRGGPRRHPPPAGPQPDERQLRRCGRRCGRGRSRPACWPAAYNILWVAQTSLGMPDSAIWAHKALEMYQGSGDLVGEANVLNNLGIEAYFAGDWSAAVEYYSVSRDLRRQAGDVVGGGVGGEQPGGGAVAAGAVRGGDGAVRLRPADVGVGRLPAVRRLRDGQSGPRASAGR